MDFTNNWRPSATIETIKQRSELIAKIRSFFASNHYLEVETPVLSSFGVTDVYLSNMKAKFRNQNYFLQTSPEYHMKRLLAAGSGNIFQLSRVFRDDEFGRWHNPEFTLLEWYQLDIDHHQLMDQMNLFLQKIANFPPMRRVTYQQIFQDICNIDVLSADVHELRYLCKKYDLDNVLSNLETDQDLYLFLLMSHVIEKELALESSPVAIFDFPASQASLARVNREVASRFEVYFRGVELANGFHELTDFTAQKARFEFDQQQRSQHNLPTMEIDGYLLAALKHGLPACSGVALGVDRLCALYLNKDSISEVIAFNFKTI